jgi:hypothetical protein
MTTIEQLEQRIESLEARVADLEHQRVAPPKARAGAAEIPPLEADSLEWTTPYEVAQLEVADTWIELHEHSARPQLQRLIREVVEVEGPVTEQLILERVRKAWGLKRAGGRVAEAVQQAIRQLVARQLIARDEDACMIPGSDPTLVRTPTADEASKRGADDVPLVELVSAVVHACRHAGGVADEQALTMSVAKLFGWTRRGPSIQARLDRAIARAVEAGKLVRDGSNVTCVTSSTKS